MKINKSFKKKILGIFSIVAIIGSIPSAVYAIAETVYYNGDAVYWDHGRAWGVYSYSNVQTHKFEHCSTANSNFSGWKDPGELAEASDFVGTGTAFAYWDCR